MLDLYTILQKEAPIKPLPVQGSEQRPALGTRYCPPEPKRDTWTVSRLLTTAFPETRYCVPDLLPTGLGILAGLPKRGKSFLALALSIAVSCGGRFLDKGLDKGHVVYVALEDSPRRIKDRLQKMSAPATCDLSFEFSWQPLDKGGMAGLGKLIEETRPKLVILDTLTRCFSSRIDWLKQNDTTSVLSVLQRMAIDHDMTILLIDHLRKGSSAEGDSIQDVAGSIAKTACLDTLWTLHRKRGEHGATLPQALVELETLAREAIGVNSEIRLKIEAQQLPLGERLMKKAAQIPSGGFVQGETFEGANIIITFAKPPSQ